MSSYVQQIPIEVTKNGLNPAVVYLGPEGVTAGAQLFITFSVDWSAYTKEIIFYDTRGNVIISPILTSLLETAIVTVPVELTMYGGPHKFTLRGFTVDNGYINDELQVTGTIVTAYTPGMNPRLEGKLLPSTMDLWLYQADQAVKADIEQMKASGDFDGEDGKSAGFGTVSATANTLNPGNPASVSVTASGPDTAKNLSFVFGIPKGDTVRDIPNGLKEQNGLVYLAINGTATGNGANIVGKNFTILGHYASLQALEAAVPDPEVGDAYSVGASTPYNVYVFDGVTHAWANYGAISTNGTPVTVDDSIIENSENPVQSKVIQSYVTGLIPAVPTELPNPYALTIFGSAYDGSAAVTVTMDSAMSDSSANAVQNQVIKAYIDGLIGDVDTAIAAINAVVGTPESVSDSTDDSEEAQ